MSIPHRFPTGGQYQEAVQHPGRCFADPDLTSASFERMTMGLPKMISGNFASVFPMTATTGHRYAVKCFTREVPHQLQRYKLIGDFLSRRRPWWATDFQFIRNGIDVDGAWYPILRMNWVNGLTLIPWISKFISSPATLDSLAGRFDELVADLASSRMAHGDLQAGNLLVTDSGTLHLVDYDGMYVPGLEGFPAGEVGHPDYQPPTRLQTDYGPTMDRFSAWLISLSLKMLVADPTLWDQLNPGRDDYLLLGRRDLADLTSSPRFSILASHRNAEVRRLAHLARDILPLPLAAIPVLAVPAPTRARDQASAPVAAGGVPSWMKTHIAESIYPPGQPDDQAHAGYAQQSELRARSLTWLVRGLAVLPLAAFSLAAWNWPASLMAFGAVTFLVTVLLWALYRHDPLTRSIAQLRRARRKAVADASRSAQEISRVKKEMDRTERTLQRLASQSAKKRASVQDDFERRQRRVAHNVESIDRQLAQLGSRRQREAVRRLKQWQEAYVNHRLTQAIIDSSHVPGIGSQLVARLRSVGIRSAADFAGISVAHDGRSTTVYFRLAAGGHIHVPGIGEVKARRIDQWRQLQVASAVRHQPSALPISELSAIDAEFATQERQLQQERERVTRQIADQIIIIQQELNTALANVEKQHQADRIPIDQGKVDLARQLGQAHSGHLAAQQRLMDWDRHLAAAPRPGLTRYVRAALKR
jgi:hypothetical protein